MKENESWGKKILGRPLFYDFFQMIVGARLSREKIVREYFKIEEGMRVLDIGCGTAEILEYLPTDIKYVGFDCSSEYIRMANRRFGNRGLFFHGFVTDAELEKHDTFDCVLAIGVLHHLNDFEAEKLFLLANNALNLKGRLIAVDCCYVPKQRRLARWFAHNDRGKFVRLPEEYEMLAEKYFSKVVSFQRDNLLRLPYDHSILICRS